MSLDILATPAGGLLACTLPGLFLVVLVAALWGASEVPESDAAWRRFERAGWWLLGAALALCLAGDAYGVWYGCHMPRTGVYVGAEQTKHYPGVGPDK